MKFLLYKTITVCPRRCNEYSILIWIVHFRYVKYGQNLSDTSVQLVVVYIVNSLMEFLNEKLEE